MNVHNRIFINARVYFSNEAVRDRPVERTHGHSLERSHQQSTNKLASQAAIAWWLTTRVRFCYFIELADLHDYICHIMT
jgi:hypothetical protein